MRFVRSEESMNMEIEELKRMLVSCAGFQRKKDDEEFKRNRNVVLNNINGDREDKLVCVTSGVSFFGLALLDCLLRRGYSVRVIADHHEEREGLTEVMRRTCTGNVSVVTAKLTDVDELAAAFEGCRGVFHTSSFTDPAGLSGYSKSMAEVEVKTTENVMKACASAAATSSVRKCVLTSSLLACIWRDASLHDLSPVINHDSWSDESLCINKKLWYALGKLKAEKTAWKLAKENNLNLATICPGLVMGPNSIHKNSTATVAYLKGAQAMYADGLLAAVDVMRLAEAHVLVYESMNKTASARYICFDRVISSDGEAEDLAKETGLPPSKICGNAYDEHIIPRPFQLSKRTLTSLMSSTLRRCRIESFNEW